MTDDEKSAWNNPTIPMYRITSNDYQIAPHEWFLDIMPSSGLKVTLTLPSSAKVGLIYRIYKRDYFSLELKAPDPTQIYILYAWGISPSVTITKGALITAIFDGTGWLVYPQQ